MIQKDGIAANPPLATVRRRRTVARGGLVVLILDYQSSLHRDKPGGGVFLTNFNSNHQPNKQKNCKLLFEAFPKIPLTGRL